MIVEVKKLPIFEELLLILKGQFSDYKVYAFYSAPLKSIIIRKSATVGAQITVYGNEVNVDACFPNIFISSLMSLLSSSTIFPFVAWPKFEIEVSDVLKKTFNQ